VTDSNIESRSISSATRRNLIVGATVAAAGVASGSALASDRRTLTTPAPSKDGFSSLSPDEALELLKAGNKAFLEDRLPRPLTNSERRLELAKGQTPFCAYVSCSDSRVPPELLFGRGLGELFIVRNAGNTVDTVALGSIEFAVAVLKVPLIVVMGHGACGAVKAAMDVVANNARFPGAIGRMIEPIVPAVLESRGGKGDPTENAIKQNVRRTVRFLREDADNLLLKPQSEGKLKVAGAYYHLDTGFVEFFDVR
jgi:carbonic anhydrase